MPEVRLDGIDIINNQNSDKLVVSDVVNKLSSVDISSGESIPVAKLDASNLADGQVLTYESGKWVNKSTSGGASGSVIETDIGIQRTDDSTAQTIDYNFGNTPDTSFLAASKSSGVDVTSDGTDTTFTFNRATEIINAVGLAGIDTSTLTDGSTLYWDSTSNGGEWKMSSLIIEEE